MIAAVRELCHLNAYLISRAKLALLTLALRLVSTLLFAVRTLWQRLVGLECRIERAIFGEEHVILAFFTESELALDWP